MKDVPRRTDRLDRLTNRVTTMLSQKFTRRDSLTRLGAFVAGLAGVSFAYSTVSQPALAATPACTHITTTNEACKNKAGIKCGFNNTKDCTRFRADDTCSCSVDRDGCPDGTKKGTKNWRSCCACANDTTTGEYIEYWDCCGTLSDACKKCTNVASCNDNVQACAAGSWCGCTPGSPACTFLVQTSETCKP